MTHSQPRDEEENHALAARTKDDLSSQLQKLGHAFRFFM